MIEKFRKASESWVVRGFFLFMAVAFAIMWGGGDLAGRFSSNRQTIITVGKHKITTWEFADTLNRHIHQIQMRTGEMIDDEKARQMGLYQIIRDRLINETLLELEAERLGIYVTDDYIRLMIKKDANFQDVNGVFDKNRFLTLISKVGYDEKTYVETLRRDLTRERLIDALSSGVVAPMSLTIPLYRWDHEQRQISTVTLDSKSVKITAKPTDEQLKAFYKEHEKEFKAPEYREVSALLLDVETLKDHIQINEEDAQAAFDARQGEFAGKTFAQVKAQIVSDLKKQLATEQIQQLISQVDDAVGAGSTLQEIANKYNLEMVTLKRLDVHGQTDPFAPQDHPSTEGALREIDLAILKEAFVLDAEMVSSVVDAGNGRYFIAHVDAIIPSQMRTFEQVQPKLAHFWKKAEQIKHIQQQAQEIIEETNKGKPFTVVASLYKLKPVGSRISRQGAVAPSVIKLAPQAIDQLFNTPKGSATGFISEQNEEGIKIMVAAVNTIERPEVKEIGSALKEAQRNVRELLINDMITEYINALRKRFPVDINKRFFAKG
jgi:peptidyl-prolyl cis-trans isomerase D